jgi:hypothetical protein
LTVPHPVAEVVRGDIQWLGAEFGVHRRFDFASMGKKFYAAEAARIAETQFLAIIKLECDVDVIRSGGIPGYDGELSGHAQVHAQKWPIGTGRVAEEIHENPLAATANGCYAHAEDLLLPMGKPWVAQFLPTVLHIGDTP